MAVIYGAGRVRQIFYNLRTEASGPGRDAAALGVGIFIGCTPFYGFHLLLVWSVGWLLRLNRLKMYLAANISNPVFSPLLMLSELQTGAWVRGDDLHELSLAAIRTTNVWVYAGDLLVGSLVVGIVLGSTVAAVTYVTAGAARRGDPFARLWEYASDPYLTIGITAWEFARGKLRGDPLYRAAAAGGLLRDGGTLVDVGCGQGLMLSVLVQARRLRAEGMWPDTALPPPRFARLVGIEIRPRVARLAQEALGSAVEVLACDARDSLQVDADAVLFFDVLHLIPPEGQEQLIAAASAALAPGGTMLIREADPSGGWRFTAVRLGNRLKAIAVGRWRQPFHFRTVEAWTALLNQHGLQCDTQPMGQGTPFANLLLRGVRSTDRPALHELADMDNRGRGEPGAIEFTPEPERARQR